ncbi:DNA-directed RNA polymerase i subunit rpa34 [Anaeramoeba flamelloides]|uniref:DNA-directed RNA polymerase i subunit rpa34 n=1 Tax=Anaeramoeba flamelloides TaxID=1746091 RepID=A0ABQ8X6Z0_9EUKA|nr:DNA-directed RNA polymerase i subunit rpa34 [Anaeramoeba flamelloides]
MSSSNSSSTDSSSTDSSSSSSEKNNFDMSQFVEDVNEKIEIEIEKPKTKIKKPEKKKAKGRSTNSPKKRNNFFTISRGGKAQFKGKQNEFLKRGVSIPRFATVKQPKNLKTVQTMAKISNVDPNKLSTHDHLISTAYNKKFVELTQHERNSLQKNFTSLTNEEIQEGEQPNRKKALKKEVQERFAGGNTSFDSLVIAPNGSIISGILQFSVKEFNIVSFGVAKICISYKQPLLKIHLSKDDNKVLRLQINKTTKLLFILNNDQQRFLVWKTFLMYKTYNSNEVENFRISGSILGNKSEISAISLRCWTKGIAKLELLLLDPQKENENKNKTKKKKKKEKEKENENENKINLNNYQEIPIFLEVTLKNIIIKKKSGLILGKYSWEDRVIQFEQNEKREDFLNLTVSKISSDLNNLSFDFEKNEEQDIETKLIKDYLINCRNITKVKLVLSCLSSFSNANIDQDDNDFFLSFGQLEGVNVELLNNNENNNNNDYSLDLSGSKTDSDKETDEDTSDNEITIQKKTKKKQKDKKTKLGIELNSISDSDEDGLEIKKNPLVQNKKQKRKKKSGADEKTFVFKIIDKKKQYLGNGQIIINSKKMTVHAIDEHFTLKGVKSTRFYFHQKNQQLGCLNVNKDLKIFLYLEDEKERKQLQKMFKKLPSKYDKLIDHTIGEEEQLISTDSEVDLDQWSDNDPINLQNKTYDVYFLNSDVTAKGLGTIKLMKTKLVIREPDAEKLNAQYKKTTKLFTHPSKKDILRIVINESDIFYIKFDSFTSRNQFLDEHKEFLENFNNRENSSQNKSKKGNKEKGYLDNVKRHKRKKNDISTLTLGRRKKKLTEENNSKDNDGDGDKPSETDKKIFKVFDYFNKPKIAKKYEITMQLPIMKLKELFGKNVKLPSKYIKKSKKLIKGDKYTEFEYFLLDSYQFIHSILLLSKIKGIISTFRALVYLFEENDAAVPLLQYFIKMDLENCQNPTFLFSETDISNQLWISFCKLPYNVRYVRRTLRPAFREINQLEGNLKKQLKAKKIDSMPSKEELILQKIDIIFEAIINSRAMVPNQLIAILESIKENLLSKFVNETYPVLYKLVLSYLFNEAISSPIDWWMLEKKNFKKNKKFIDTLSNVSNSFVTGEPIKQKEYLSKELNQYIEKKSKFIKFFINSMSTVKEGGRKAPKVPLQSNCYPICLGIIHDFSERQRADILTKLDTILTKREKKIKKKIENDLTSITNDLPSAPNYFKKL